jgi:hypothetical protein
MDCQLKNIRFSCEGRMVGNLCIEHAVMFDIWNCNGGHEIYKEHGQKAGRKIFKTWLEDLSDNDLKNTRKYG